MSAQELNRVHQRYIRTSNHFKSGWTYHQFVVGLRKAFPDLALYEYPSDFQRVYGDLKAVSQNLSETTAATADQALEQVEGQLAPMVVGLLQADNEISAGMLRQFFQRVKNYDDNILTQLIKFYLHSQAHHSWEAARIDKADFLFTKLAGTYHDQKDAFLPRDQTFLRETSQGLWLALGQPAVASEEIEPLIAQTKGFREAMGSIESLDDLHRTRLVESYRELKHQLAERYFEPAMLIEVLQSNLALKNAIHQLYKRDEQRIIAEYQQVFELERDVPVDVQLSAELSDFRQAVERFEKKLEGDDLKLAEIVELREKVRSLVPKLRPEDDADETLPVVPPAEIRRERLDDPRSGEAPPEPDVGYVESQLQAIVEALDDTNPTMDPKKVALQPDVFHLGVGPREIMAYRRIFGGGSCDRVLEHFILRAAALRARIEQEVAEIKGILDDSAVSQEAPIFRTARATCRMADFYVRRFEHRLSLCVLDGDAKEARDLQRLQMRMVRAYSGLWLMVNR
ncbi:MAG: hypothetical protein MI919_32585 [Holophagales bacterium]|nr:hypothetical protein [Holophagales bacterium]